MKVRLVRTYYKPWHFNIALDRAMLELRSKDTIPDTFRFLSFLPEAILIGYHQSPFDEINLELARKENIEIGRRQTGGGAIFLNKEQLGWEIIATKDLLNFKDYEELASKICSVAAKALSKFGIDALFRPRNDIEVNGKKISGTGGVFEGKAFLYQGTVLLDFNLKKMASLLKIPYEKLKDKNISSVEERVTFLKREIGYIPSFGEIEKYFLELFGKEFGIEFYEDDISQEELALAKKYQEEYSKEEWIYEIKSSPKESSYEYKIFRIKGATLHIYAKLKNNVLESLIINGDFFVKPRNLIYDLEAFLKFTHIDEIEDRINDFFDSKEDVYCSFSKEDLIQALKSFKI